MKRTYMAVLLAVLLLLTGCTAKKQERQERYEATYYDLFDTVTSVVGYAASRQDFDKTVEQLHENLLHYHQLYNIYESYDGVVNLKTVNEEAGKAPVSVAPELMNLLILCRDMEAATNGTVNPAMGTVLQLWHEARTAGVEQPEQAEIPDMQALRKAAEHCSFSEVILDEKQSTVYFQDPDLRLDVGAVAKGYAAEQACRQLPSGYLVSVGGNVCCTGPKPDGSDWGIGLQDPDGNGILATVQMQQGCVVTSGDYQRYYTVQGTRYHHLIDPETLMPGTRWRSVSIICDDSGIADALSTALFLLPQEEGEKLLAEFDAEAFWVSMSGEQFSTPGFANRIL